MIKKLTAAIICLCLLVSFSPAFAQSDMTTGDAAAELIAGWEGFSAYAYKEGPQWYIGYGTSCGSGEYPGGITREEAFALVKERLTAFENAVNRFLRSCGATVTQNQFDAMVCLAYNLGTYWLSTSRTLGGYIKDGADNHTDAEIVNAFGVYCHVQGKVSAPLCRRRIAEAKMFLYADYSGDDSGWVWLTVDAGEGDTESDVYFYQEGKPYGELPSAQLGGYRLEGWYTADGTRLLDSSPALRSVAVTARYQKEEAVDDFLIFPDVKQGEWYSEYISFLVDGGLVSGCSDGLFHPERDVTCGDALRRLLLDSRSGEQAPSGGHWAGGYLDLAISRGYLNEGEITDLNEPITRDLIAKVASNALGLKASGAQQPFTDTDKEYVQALYDAGIVDGIGGGRFDPGSTLRRSAVCAIVWRIMNSGLY